MNPILLTDLFHFVVRPTDQKTPLPVWQAGWQTVRVWAVLYGLNLLAAIGIFGLLAVFGQTPNSNAVVQLAQALEPWQLLFLAGVLIPIWEELSFRLGLRWGRANLSAGLAALGLFFAQVPLQAVPGLPTWLFNLTDPLGVTSVAVVWAVLAGGLWLVLGRLNLAGLEAAYTRHYRWVVYGAVILFAALHAFNYENLSDIWFLAPVLVLPQLLLGLGLAYVRARLGWVWAVLMHMVHNSFSLLPTIILSSLSADITAQMLAGNWAALAQLDAEASLTFFAVSAGWYLLLLGLFFGAASVVWELVQARRARQPYALISPALNCLLPGLGQLYNHQTDKGRMVIAIFVGLSVFGGLVFSVPALYADPTAVLGLTGLMGVLFLGLYAYATTDAWLVGARLDRG